MFNKIIFISIFIGFLSACSQKPITIQLTNPLDMERVNETVEIDLSELPTEVTAKIDKLGIYDPSTENFLIS